MKIASTTPDLGMIEELGRRGQQQRVGMNLTQAQLAEAAGVGQRTIERFEGGSSVQLDKLIRILRALRLADNFDQLIPETTVRPLQLVGVKEKTRVRARNKVIAKTEDWLWGDQK